MSTPGLSRISGIHAQEAARLARERKEAENEAHRLEAQLESARHRAEQKRQEERQSQDAAKQAFQAEHGERQAAFRVSITQGRIEDLRIAIGTDEEVVEKIEAVAAGNADAQVLDSFADTVLETLSGGRNQFLQSLAIKMFEKVPTLDRFPQVADEIMPEMEADVASSTGDNAQGVTMYEPAALWTEEASEVLRNPDGDDRESNRRSPAQSSQVHEQPLDSMDERRLAPHPANTIWNAVGKITEAEAANAQSASLFSENTLSIADHAADDDNSEITPSIAATSTSPVQLGTKRKRQSPDALTEASLSSIGPPPNQATEAKVRYNLKRRAKDFVKALKDLAPEDKETYFRCTVCSGCPIEPRISKCLHLYCDACWDQRLKQGGRKGIKTICARDMCTSEMGKKAKMQKTEHPSLAPLHQMKETSEGNREEDADDGSGGKNMGRADGNATQAEFMEA